MLLNTKKYWSQPHYEMEIQEIRIDQSMNIFIRCQISISQYIEIVDTDQHNTIRYRPIDIETISRSSIHRPVSSIDSIVCDRSAAHIIDNLQASEKVENAILCRPKFNVYIFFAYRTQTSWRDTSCSLDLFIYWNWVAVYIDIEDKISK
jgi:hypothetical protein